LRIFFAEGNWSFPGGFFDFRAQERGFWIVVCDVFVVKTWFLNARILRGRKICPRFPTLFFQQGIRGYTAGRYLDRYMLATQLEYRLALPWRFGVVGFGGVGAVAPGGVSFRSNQWLPAGTGVRYMLSKKYHVNLRTDFAWGKDNFTWAVGVGEAF
jgi:hypothetical protein